MIGSTICKMMQSHAHGPIPMRGVLRFKSFPKFRIFKTHKDAIIWDKPLKRIENLIAF